MNRVRAFDVRVQADPFDIADEIAAMSGTGDVGAVVSFTGYCRADKSETGIDGALAALVLEHYPGMAEAEMERLMDEARTRWPLLGARIIHRHGRIVPGEQIVLVVTSSAHRDAAFAAASFLMDWLKTNAPFWKKEERAGGGDWVAAKDSDTDAALRWTKG
ncbi:MAG: molybdenum cofactor biosynthesis protein MoaE [Pseudomonadota bacterium]